MESGAGLALDRLVASVGAVLRLWVITMSDALKICDVCYVESGKDIGNLDNTAVAVQTIEIVHSHERKTMKVDLCGNHLRQTPVYDLLTTFVK